MTSAKNLAINRMLSSNSPDAIINCDYGICQMWYKVQTVCTKASRCFPKFIQVSPQYNGIQENVVTLLSSALLQVYSSASGNKRVITCSSVLIHTYMVILASSHVYGDTSTFITPARMTCSTDFNSH